MKIYRKKCESEKKAKASISERRLSMLDNTNKNENMREDDLIADVLEVEVLYR